MIIIIMKVWLTGRAAGAVGMTYGASAAQLALIS